MSIASYLRSYRAHVESLWFSGRASERGIRRSEVRFQKGTQNFFLVPRSRQDEKHLSQNFSISLNNNNNDDNNNNNNNNNDNNNNDFIG